MITYYSSMFAVTVVVFIYLILQYKNRNTNYNYLSLVILMMVSNAGYLAVALSRTLEEAILANKILYIGACFVQPVLLILICSLVNFKMNTVLKFLNYGYSLLVYLMVLTIGYTDLYYKEVYIKTYKDATVIGHIYGVGHNFFYVLIVGHILISIGLIVYIILKRCRISKRNIICLLSMIGINVYTFLMGRIINPSIEMMPSVYAVSCIILAYMYRRSVIYDFEDNVMEAQKEENNAYIMFDEYLNFIGANSHAEQIFPQLKESIVDRALDNEQATEIIMNWIHRYIDENVRNFEYRAQDAHYECEVRTLFYNDQFRGYMIKMRDNTDEWKYTTLMALHNEELEREVEKQLRISEELRIAKIEAESANEAKSQFLARMSHEIRTPINAVIGMNDIIIRDSQEEEIRKRSFDIKSAANTLLGIINEILDSSKIDAGMMEIISGSYDMPSLLNDLYNMVFEKAKSKNLELIFDIDPNIPIELYGDSVRIKQILINLLSNAVKYTNEGSITLKIYSEIVGSSATTHYSVIDTGVGIKEEDFKKLFEKFERIEEAKNRDIEGTGLGLNIAYRLLSLMGSELKVKSEYQKGSEFYFDLKQKIVNIEPIGDFQNRLEIVEENESYQISYTAPEARVLVVDDNEMNRSVFIGLLEPTQIQIFEASSGQECLDILQKEKFHMVFLDHMMPGMDGVETFEIIKEMKLCEDTPVIMFSANVMSGEREKYIKQGFENFLAKPVAVEQLNDMILKYLPKDLIKEGKAVKVEAKTSNIDDLPVLDEFDFQYALGMLKKKELLMQSLSNFNDLLKIVPEKLDELVKSIGDEQGLSAYRIEVHALKGTAATVGALLLSKLARMLEVAAANGDINKIEILHPILLEELEKHAQRVATLFPEETQEIEDIGLLNSYLDMLDIGVSQGDYDTADFIMEEIKKYSYPKEVQVLVDNLTGKVLNMETANIVEIIKKIKEFL